MGVTNHPLIGQRVRLTGEAWLNRGEVCRVAAYDAADDSVEVDLNEDGRLDVGHLPAWAYLDPGHIFAGEVVRTIYGSRSRNVDPLPYVDGHTDAAGSPRRFAEPYHVDGDGTDCPWCITRYAPRPEFDPTPIHPVNPILAAFRRADAARLVKTYPTMSSLAEAWASGLDQWGVHASVAGNEATEQHVEHARRVIERLARL